MLAAFSVIVVLLLVRLIPGQTMPPTEEKPAKTRQDAIPEDAIRILREDDIYPPVLHLDLWYDPIPFPIGIRVPDWHGRGVFQNLARCRVHGLL